MLLDELDLTEIATQLRERGITHVLLAQDDAQPRQSIGAPDISCPNPALTERLLPLADFRLTRGDAAVWRYSLLRVR